jgi:hypothetical protein
MRRTTRFQALNEAHVSFDSLGIQVGCLPPTGTFDENEKSTLGISFDVEWQLLSLAQDFTSFIPSIYTVEHLYIYVSYWRSEIGNRQWLEYFHPFAAVKNLYVPMTFVECIVPALEELVEERVIDLFPNLENLFLEEFPPWELFEEDIGRFVAALRLLGHSVAVSRWNRERTFLR